MCVEIVLKLREGVFVGPLDLSDPRFLHFAAWRRGKRRPIDYRDASWPLSPQRLLNLNHNNGLSASINIPHSSSFQSTPADRRCYHDPATGPTLININIYDSHGQQTVSVMSASTLRTQSTILPKKTIHFWHLPATTKVFLYTYSSPSCFFKRFNKGWRY